MKLRGSLACLLLALCLGRGAASPLQSGGEGTGSSAAEGVGDAIGEAVGEGAKEAASSGIQNALGQGHGEEGGYALRGARGDAFDHRLGEAARSLGNAGDEVRRQAEDVVRRGMDAAHNSGSWVSGWEAGCAGRGKNSRNGSRVKRWFLGGCLGLLLWLSCISSPLPPPTPGWCRLPLSLMIARDGHTKDGCIVCPFRGRLEAMECLALKVVLEAMAIPVVKGPPGPQKATLEPTLRVALWVRVVMAGHSTMRPMLR